MDVIDTLQARGFIRQSTGMNAIRQALSSARITYYTGFDPTAPSLHVGHLVPVYAMAWLQRAGHRPIVVVGGGTAQVGDPSGRTELRQLLSQDQIAANATSLKHQLGALLNLDGDQGILVNNADWLTDLSYLDFLRSIGRHFSVNRMLTAESYKRRLEVGLSFIEFNYQLLQAYDFLQLHQRYGCGLQLGGDDQWGNVLAGTELIRRVTGSDAHGLTQPLLTTASGTKMGKTAQGAVWLDPNLYSDFDFFQYWLTVDDCDVGRLLRLYTFLPLPEVQALEALQGADIREAKRVLAREVTTLIRGKQAAAAAEKAGHAMTSGQATSELPTHQVRLQALSEGLKLYVLLPDAGLAKSRSAARRLMAQGGVKVNDNRITDSETTLTAADFAQGPLVIRVGKKHAVRVVLAVG